MSSLTDEQMAFLGSQGIPISRVFDATGMRFREWQPLMTALGLDVAAGVTPCRRHGHTLRTRYNHCVQCGTHNLAFLKRYEDDGEVYVAESIDISLLKIGTSKSAFDRIRMLNIECYGGASDWLLRFSAPCRKAGRVEFTAQHKVQPYRRFRSYVKSGRRVECQELFECSTELAIDAVKSAISEIMVGDLSYSNKTASKVRSVKQHDLGEVFEQSESNVNGEYRSYKVYDATMRVPNQSLSGLGGKNSDPSGSKQAPRQDYRPYSEKIRIPSRPNGTNHGSNRQGQQIRPTQNYRPYAEKIRIPRNSSGARQQQGNEPSALAPDQTINCNVAQGGSTRDSAGDKWADEARSRDSDGRAHPIQSLVKGIGGLLLTALVLSVAVKLLKVAYMVSTTP